MPESDETRNWEQAPPEHPGEPQAASLPPHATASEQQLLGGLIVGGPEAWESVFGEVMAEDFSHARHQVIFRAMQRMAEAGVSIDHLLLADHLERAGQLQDAGSYEYLSELAVNAGSMASLPGHAALVGHCAIRRSLMRVGRRIAELGEQPGESSAIQLQAAAGELLAELENRGGVNQQEAKSLRELYSDTLQRLEELNLHGHKPGLETGFKDLDKMLIGLRPGDLMILAARPSAGKTAMALNIAAHVARSQDRPTILFSMEMSALDINCRLLCQEGRVNSARMFGGNLNDNDYAQIERVSKQMLDMSMYIDDAATLTPGEVNVRAARIARKLKKQPGLIVIDYLQLMNADQRIDNRVAELARITRSIKALAKRFQCPIMALSQLSRAPMSRPDPRPILSDLRDSGAIEQDADVVVFIHRREQHVANVKPEDKGKAEILVAKNRNGPTGSCTMAFRKDQMRFADFASDEALPAGYQVAHESSLEDSWG